MLFLGWSEATRAFVPPLVIKPLLECLKPDLRIPSSKFANVCLKSGFIEPTEHLVVLLVRRDWQFQEFDRLAQNAAEYFGGLRTCQLTAGNLQLQANKLLRAFKRQSDEASDIISDAIVWYGLSARIGYMSLP